MEGKPISILYTESFKWYNPETGKTEASQKCLIPVSEKDILMYRVNDENILVKKEDLFYEMPDFASGSIEAFMSHSSFSGLIIILHLILFVGGMAIPCWYMMNRAVLLLFFRNRKVHLLQWKSNILKIFIDLRMI